MDNLLRYCMSVSTHYSVILHYKKKVLYYIKFNSQYKTL